MSRYDWICDNCGKLMNNQEGFSTSNGEWTCTKCGYKNDVSSNIIRHYGERPATEDQLSYISKIEN